MNHHHAVPSDPFAECELELLRAAFDYRRATDEQSRARLKLVAKIQTYGGHGVPVNISQLARVSGLSRPTLYRSIADE